MNARIENLLDKVREAKQFTQDEQQAIITAVTLAEIVAIGAWTTTYRQAFENLAGIERVAWFKL